MRNNWLTIMLVFGLAFEALSQDVTPRTDAREHSQRTRIHQGRASGEVTRSEARALNQEQRQIKRTERRAKADGTFTPQEKMRLERRQDRASRHIRKAKHNRAAQ